MIVLYSQRPLDIGFAHLFTIVSSSFFHLSRFTCNHFPSIWSISFSALLTNMITTNHVDIVHLTYNYSELRFAVNVKHMLDFKNLVQKCKISHEFFYINYMLKWYYLGYIGLNRPLLKLTVPFFLLLKMWLLEHLNLHVPPVVFLLDNSVLKVSLMMV